MKRVVKLASTKIKSKLAVIFIIVILLFITVLLRVTYIGTVKNEAYTRKIYEQQQYDSSTIKYKRGNIEDRKGTILASSRRVYNVILDANVLVNVANSNKNTDIIDNTKKALSSIFDIEEETVQKRIDSNPTSSYIILKKNVSIETADVYNNYYEKNKDKIAGIWLEDDYERYYPYNSLACNVIGFSNSSNEGNLGLEQFYDNTLKGANGRKYGYLKSDESFEKIIRQPQNGNSIATTIDVNIQSIVENHIAAFNNTHANEARPGRGSMNTGMIVMNPNNGEILAMASYPNFNLNDPYNIDAYYTKEEQDAMSDEELTSAIQQIWKNFCISDLYEPGSTSKAITVAAALEEGVLKGNEEFDCGGGLYVNDYYIKCHNTNGHGHISLSDSISMSCNVAMMDIGLKLGADRLVKYLSLCNFGSETGIDLPGEAVGQLYDPEEMIEADIATNSFGQNFTCSMIQMASAYCSLVNGGLYYRPYIVKEIKNSSGDTISTVNPVVLKKPISQDTSDKLKSYMEQAVTRGTAILAQTPGYEVGGKTGTAEKLPRGQNNYVTSLACFSPVDKPEVVVYTVINEPNVQNQGMSDYAVSLTRDVLGEILPYINSKASLD